MVAAFTDGLALVLLVSVAIPRRYVSCGGVDGSCKLGDVEPGQCLADVSRHRQMDAIIWLNSTG